MFLVIIFLLINLIESWPNWPGKWLNVFGTSGSGKTHLSKILEKKIKRIKLVDAKELNNKIIENLINIDCLIIDNYQNNIDEKLFYSILNQSKQLDRFVVVNSIPSLKELNFKLIDLKSRLDSFIFIGITLPTDDLLQVVISKFFSEKQIYLNPKIYEYIIKNVDRSYEKMFKFLKDIDELSLSTGKSININLIKKAINK